MARPRREKLQPMQHMPAYHHGPEAREQQQIIASLDVPVPPRTLSEILSTAPDSISAAMKARKQLRLESLGEGFQTSDRQQTPYSHAVVPKPIGASEKRLASMTVQKSDNKHMQPRYLDQKREYGESQVHDDAAAWSNRPEGGRASSNRPVPGVKRSTTVELQVSEAELQELQAGVRDPSESLAILGASLMIMMTRGNEVPKDVRWSAFAALPAGDVVSNLQTVIPDEVPGFKLRALKHFLTRNAFDAIALESDVSPTAGKLAAWLLRVIAQHPEGGAFIKQVRESLEAWDALEAQRQARDQAAKTKRKRVRKRKKKAVSKKEEEHPEVLELFRSVREAGADIHKEMVSELRAFKLVPESCKVTLEAVTLLLNPGTPLPKLKMIMARSAAIHPAISGFTLAAAKTIPPRTRRAVEKLASTPCVADEDKLSHKSVCLSRLMRWVRAVLRLLARLHQDLPAYAARDMDAAVGAESMRAGASAKPAASETVGTDERVAETSPSTPHEVQGAQSESEVQAQTQESSGVGRIESEVQAEVPASPDVAAQAPTPVHVTAATESQDDGAADARAHETSVARSEDQSSPAAALDTGSALENTAEAVDAKAGEQACIPAAANKPGEPDSSTVRHASPAADAVPSNAKDRACATAEEKSAHALGQPRATAGASHESTRESGLSGSAASSYDDEMYSPEPTSASSAASSSSSSSAADGASAEPPSAKAASEPTSAKAAPEQTLPEAQNQGKNAGPSGHSDSQPEPGAVSNTEAQAEGKVHAADLSSQPADQEHQLAATEPADVSNDQPDAEAPPATADTPQPASSNEGGSQQQGSDVDAVFEDLLSPEPEAAREKASTPSSGASGNAGADKQNDPPAVEEEEDDSLDDYDLEDDFASPPPTPAKPDAAAGQSDSPLKHTDTYGEDDFDDDFDDDLSDG